MFESVDFEPSDGLNIIVGDNESGKSTLLEAIGLALTGRINGRPASEELQPYWFNNKWVSRFFQDHSSPFPKILVELYLRDDDELQSLRGVHNSAGIDCPGILIDVSPSPDYRSEFSRYLDSNPPPLVPVEYYSVDWRDFADNSLLKRPKALATSIIDSRTIRSTSGVDYHTRQMLAENLDAAERAAVSSSS